MEQDERDKRVAWSNGLRSLADFIDAHDDYPLPDEVHLGHFLYRPWTWDDESQGEWEPKPELARLARILGNVEKSSSGGTFRIEREFGPHMLRVYADQVCERVVVGTEEVDEIDYENVPRKKVQREIVEWKCPDSILEAG